MARKKRDYKAEYAARKRKAQNAGYSSVKSYSRARKVLRIPRNASPISRPIAERIVPEVSRPNRRITAADRELSRLRRESQIWSDNHSRIMRSMYSRRFPDERVRDYHRAYVADITGVSRRKKAQEKRRRIHEYLAKYHGVTDEWDQQWTSELSPA